MKHEDPLKAVYFVHKFFATSSHLHSAIDIMSRSMYPPVFSGPVDQSYRHRAAEYDPISKRWFQDDRRLPKQKSSYAFVWPKDGKRDSKMGRLMDILQNKGPDMYLTKNAHRLDYMANRPTRERWAGWTNLDDRDAYNSLNSRKFAPWVQKGIFGGRERGLGYDFRTRKYGVPNRATWTDARWQSGSKEYKWPEAIRNVYGDWYQDPQWLPWEIYGPLHNSIGRTNS
jgi:hypothetical protein